MNWKSILFVIVGLIIAGAIFGPKGDLCESYGFTKGTAGYTGCQWEVVNDQPVTRP